MLSKGRLILLSSFLISVILILPLNAIYASPPSLEARSSFDQTPGRAVFISITSRVPFLNRTVGALQSIGYSVDVVLGRNFTVGFLKSQLRHYDLIIIRSGVFWYKGPYRLLTLERVVNRTAYASDLAEKRLYVVNGYYAVSPTFFSHYYGDKGLEGKIVIVEASNIGMISPTLIESCGAKAVIGFSAPYLHFTWGMADLIIYHLVNNLANGMTVREAVRVVFRNLIYEQHEAEYPYNTLTYTGDGEAKLSIFQETIKPCPCSAQKVPLDR